MVKVYVLFVLVGFLPLGWLTWRANSLETELAKLHAEADEHERVLAKIRQAAADFYQSLHNVTEVKSVLLNKLSHCTSRDDFLVRDGPMIAMSKLKWDQPDSARIVFYVPAIQCKLAVTSDLIEASEHGAFRENDPRNFRDVMRLDLTTPEVYQIDIAFHEKKKQVELKIFGQENRVLYEEEFLIASPEKVNWWSIFQFRGSESKMMYPGELEMELFSQPEYSKAILYPISELTMLTVLSATPGKWFVLRLWLEPDSPPLMPLQKMVMQIPAGVSRFVAKPPSDRYDLDKIFEPKARDGMLIFKPQFLQWYSKSQRK